MKIKIFKRGDVRDDNWNFSGMGYTNGFVSWSRNGVVQLCHFDNRSFCGSWCSVFRIRKWKYSSGASDDFIVEICCGKKEVNYNITEPIPDDCKNWVEE